MSQQPSESILFQATLVLELQETSLKPAPNQVAGHRFDEGRQGSMVDDHGRFYKPLQSGERGQAEAAFYERLCGDSSVPESIKRVFPGYFGVVEKSSADGGQPVRSHPVFLSAQYLVMEDLTAGYLQPCIIDIKMGRTTWYEGAPQKYIDKCLEKDASTTSGTLGYRVAGIQAYDTKSGQVWKADRKWCKEVTVESMPHALSAFLSAAPSSRAGSLDRGIAESVLRGERGLLAQLQELRDWFNTQTTYQFYSASILVIYDAKAEGDRKVRLRLVDFAHVTETGKKDLNFLEAIDAVAAAFLKLLE